MKHSFFSRASIKFLSLFVILIFNYNSVFAQQSQATLRGTVSDLLGGVITGITVTATDAAGVERTAATNDAGEYVFAALPPGRYTIRVNSAGFTPYENQGVEITAGQTEPVDIVLTVANALEEVTVTDEAPIGTEPDANVDALVLRGDELDSLPDDPDDLAEALQALAGPGAGIDEEGQLYIDGFTGGRLPPKESIREIRINRNPFSAEYDRLGYGRIEIFTKPGTDKFRGQAFFNFNDESLNSRSPFATVRAPYQRRRYGGNVSGPLIKQKLSFFLDFSRNETDDNADINAVVLDSLFNRAAINETILTPNRRTDFSPRLDWQINDTNTLVLRYSYETSERQNAGIGGFNLATRAYDTTGTEHSFRLTETSVINGNIINETRFQYQRERTSQEGGTFAPTVRVLDAFTGGGAQIGLSFNNEDSIELQNFTSWTMSTHSLKAGARLRSRWIDNSSQQNFAGTFTFAGGLAPQLDANNQIAVDANGAPLPFITIDSLERYRRTLIFRQQGLTAAEIRARGGGATQFSISGGNPEINYSQTDFSPFIQDDWRFRPNLTLSFGVRYDWQQNIDSKLNFAPRFGFAWSPASEGAGQRQARRQQTVVRGGFGIFYTDFNESLLSQTLRFNGVNQQQFLITSTTANPDGLNFLNQFPNVPTVEQIEGFAIPQTLRINADDLKTPYTMQTSLSYERGLPLNTTLSVNFVNAQTRRVLRSRNINAPINGIRPLPAEGNIFQYESTGRFNQQQLIFSLNTRFTQLFTLRTNYVLNRAKSDTDGLGSFPVNQYDLSGEYGRSLQDTRHRLTLIGSINALPWGIRLNPIVQFNSGRPFNITTGRDTNGDTLFNDRPAFADELTTAADLVSTAFGDFDINPKPGQTIIPRNYGSGPSFFVTNLRISKTFGFGEAEAGQGGDGQRGGGGGGGRRGGGGGGRRGGGAGGGESTNKRYNLNLSVNVQNLFNNTNESLPVGNLSSPFFGVSTSTAGGFGRGGGQTRGNRVIDLQLRFSF